MVPLCSLSITFRIIKSHQSYASQNQSLQNTDFKAIYLFSVKRYHTSAKEKSVPYQSKHPSRKFFMFILLISNHTVFLIQFGINLHLWVFQKSEIALGLCNFSFLKNSLVQINSKLNSKPYDYLYKTIFPRGYGGCTNCGSGNSGGVGGVILEIKNGNSREEVGLT